MITANYPYIPTNYNLSVQPINHQLTTSQNSCYQFYKPIPLKEAVSTGAFIGTLIYLHPSIMKATFGFAKDNVLPHLMKLTYTCVATMSALVQIANLLNKAFVSSLHKTESQEKLL